ncbi:Hypothetical_protein [Hexamita inflata]|uniref:Hypothetical_protein n=1 Tax=Hexamita inflata TaxID=28002 RepID=A0AA86R206_9EUKA|nr:Hypothetical protein HINF_LOCUS51849 [Hexamita inflata]
MQQTQNKFRNKFLLSLVQQVADFVPDVDFPFNFDQNEEEVHGRDQFVHLNLTQFFINVICTKVNRPRKMIFTIDKIEFFMYCFEFNSNSTDFEAILVFVSSDYSAEHDFKDLVSLRSFCNSFFFENTSLNKK